MCILPVDVLLLQYMKELAHFRKPLLSRPHCGCRDGQDPAFGQKLHVMLGFAGSVEMPDTGKSLHGFREPMDMPPSIGVYGIAAGQPFQYQAPIRFPLMGAHEMFLGPVRLQPPMLDKILFSFLGNAGVPLPECHEFVHCKGFSSAICTAGSMTA